MLSNRWVSLAHKLIWSLVGQMRSMEGERDEKENQNSRCDSDGIHPFIHKSHVYSHNT